MAIDLELKWYQLDLRGTVRSFMEEAASLPALRRAEESPEGFSVQIHRHLAELGWLEIGLDYGTAAAGPDDAENLMVLYEEYGRAAFGGPHFACQLAAVIIRSIDPDFWDGISSKIVSGELIATVALYEPHGDIEPVSTTYKETGNGYELSGSKAFVPFASGSDLLLVLAADEFGHKDFFAVTPDLDGVEMTPLRTLSGERQAVLSFNKVKLPADARVGPKNSGDLATDKVVVWSRLPHSAELAGIADRATEIAVEYAKERVAFGHPIGSYQAISHKCADMVADKDAARYLTYQAAVLCDSGQAGDARVAMAKAFALDSARRVTKEAHQILAGAGFLLEHKLNHYYRRAKGIELALEGVSDLLGVISRERLDLQKEEGRRDAS